ncbi:RD21L protein, partial [Pitta sordida]|nr:RD21L protein [Pitta sordida]
MFYVHLLINKRGPLAKIWLAAHWEKKLTKAHIFECNLEITVQKIISPKFAIALRTSGHLLLGVVRIYHRKAKYLLADCSEALTKMKTAFRPGLLDLPEENFEAAYQSVTLPEEFHDFEAPLPDVNAIDVAEHFTLNQSRAEDITLTEDYESSILLCDKNFGEEADALRRQSFFEGSTLTSSKSLEADHNSASARGDKSVLHEDVFCFQHDGFGDEEDAADMIAFLSDTILCGDISPSSELFFDLCYLLGFLAVEPNCTDNAVKDVSHTMSETLLLFKEEGFVLEPVDDTAVTQRKKNKRKRKLLVDVEKELSSTAIYNQLNNCTDILATLDLAPPAKQTMMWKELGSVEHLLFHSTQPLFHTDLQELFEKCLKNDRFKVRGGGIQRVSEMEDIQKEQDTTEMLPVEEPSYPKESAPSETEREITNYSPLLTSENGRNETRMVSPADCPFHAHSRMKQLSPRAQEIPWIRELEQRKWKCQRKDSEEVRWSKRTLQLQKTLQHLKRSGVCSFSFRELCRNSSRREVAAKFYTFLVLKKHLVLELQQREPFADLTATAGPMFDTI